MGGTSEDIGEVIRHIKHIISDSAFRNLPHALNDISAAAENIKSITEKVDQSDALWKTLNNKQLAQDIRLSVENVRKTSEQAAQLSAGLNRLVADIESGKGTASMLIAYTALAMSIRQSTYNIRILSDSLVVLSARMNSITRQVNQGQGAAGTIVSDTTFARQLKQTMTFVQNSSRSLEQNMEALKSNILFRRYFRKQEGK
jgi:phospholipid/cholesterol/gamma-HCH transport system substrate-binding protein